MITPHGQSLRATAGPAESAPRTRRLASALALAVGALALTVFAGWTFHLPQLTSLFGAIAMKTNTSIGLLLCAIALGSLGRVPPAVSSAFALAGAAIGGLTLVEHLSGWDFGIDQALFVEPAGAVATVSPNRTGPNAATSLLLAGIALTLLARGTTAAIAWAQRLSVCGVTLALLALAGFIYGAEQLYAIARYTGIAPHTALTLLLLHAGILAARSDTGPMSRFVSDGPEGLLLRRLALPITLVPLIVGYGILIGRGANLYDRGLSLALFAIAVIAVLWATVWGTAGRVEQSERERRRAEHDRDQLLIRERRARDDAERANRLKDHFIATLSHELRTPLNVMLGWTHVLETSEQPEAHPRAAAVVARNGRLLARLVEDLLDISRATAGHVELARTEVSLNAVAQAALEAMAPVAADKAVTLVSALDPAVGTFQADHERLQQVVWNLLSNAVKFTPPGGQVHVGTTIDAATAILTVTDTGIGFDADFAPFVFEPFRQADPSARREHGGLGLGLSIARHLIELHGGSITAHTDGLGSGATFTVMLPLATDRGHSAPQSTSAAAQTL